MIYLIKYIKRSSVAVIDLIKRNKNTDDDDHIEESETPLQLSLLIIN